MTPASRPRRPSRFAVNSPDGPFSTAADRPQPPAAPAAPSPRPALVLHLITRLILGGAQENTVASVLGLQRLPRFRLRLVSGPTHGPEGSLEPLVTGLPGLFAVEPSLVRPVRPLTDLRAFLRLTRRFRTERPDLVHTHSGKAGFVGRLAARAARVPVIVHTIHGPSFGPFQGPTANACFLAAERLAGRATTHFVTVADAMARQYLAAGIGRPDQYTRIFSGLDLQPFLNLQPDPAARLALGLEPEHIVVGTIARLVPLKGHEELFAAAAELVRDLPHLRFLLVGDGPLRPAFEAELARRRLTRHFVFTGLVPPAEIPRLIGAMDLLVHASRREGLPRALPQALAAGRPVVAYDCDGASEVCLNGRTGFLVPPGNLTALRERLRFLAADPRLRAELGNRGRALVRETFPVQRMVDDLAALYDRLLAAHPTGPRRRSPPASPFAVPDPDPRDA